MELLIAFGGIFDMFKSKRFITYCASFNKRDRVDDWSEYLPCDEGSTGSSLS